MITKKYLIAVGLAVFVCVSAMPFGMRAEDALKSEKTLEAAPATDAKTRDAAQRDYAEGYLAQRLGAMQQSTRLAGAAVQDREGRPLGKVEDLLLDLTSGKVFCAVVSLGQPDFRVAVPGKSFYPADNKKVVLEMSKDFLRAAPRFSTADWELSGLRKSLGESYAYFSQQPLWDGKAGPGEINRSSDFIGMEVADKNNQSLGKVANLMVDLPTARVVFAVISFDGSPTDLYAAPPEALMLTSDKKALFLDEDQAKIAPRAHPDDFFWTEMTDRTWAAEVYRTFGVEPDFDTRPNHVSDATKETVRAKVEEAPAPVNKTAGKSDSDISRSVLVAMVRDDMDNAYGRKNIKINTFNGRVTLSGKVKNEKQKDKLGAIAESVAGPGNVDNQLEIR